MNKNDYQDALEKVPCNICAADDYEIIYPARYDEVSLPEIVASFKSSGDAILFDTLVRCRSCGLQYLNPRFKSDLVLEGYAGGTDENFVSQAAARERTFAQALKRIERETKAPGRILDIGTAGGSFLHVARQRGWEVAGCEPNRWLCQWAKEHYGLTLTSGTIFDMRLEDSSFDVVTLWDVLEHTPDPKKVLAECRRVLKPDGLIIINYPDIGSWIARFMGRRWVFLLSVHLYYFTLETMLILLTRSGFKLRRAQSHWQTLELDYILFRMQKYVPFIPGLLRKIFGWLRMSHCPLPYWMGQTLVMARVDK